MKRNRLTSETVCTVPSALLVTNLGFILEVLFYEILVAEGKNITLKEDNVSALRVFVLKYYEQCAFSDTDL